MFIFDFISSLFKRFQKTMLRFQHLVLLHIFYVIGIGLTSIFAKIFGKKFIANFTGETNWVNKIKESDPQKMF